MVITQGAATSGTEQGHLKNHFCSSYVSNNRIWSAADIAPQSFQKYRQCFIVVSESPCLRNKILEGLNKL